MKKLYSLALTFAAFGVLVSPSLGQSVQTVSTGQKADLLKRLTPESPTVFVFIKSNSSLERDFLKALQKESSSKIGFGVIALKTGMEPIAKQYEVTETPTALVYDRRGRLIARSSQADAIRAAIVKAAGVMRIDWAETGDANFQESMRLLGRNPGAGILRTMTLQPEYLKYINDLSQKAHFSDGFLKRRIKEMIATYVSQINHCKY
jgi:hypothetical protein